MEYGSLIFRGFREHGAVRDLATGHVYRDVEGLRAAPTQGRWAQVGRRVSKTFQPYSYSPQDPPRSRDDRIYRRGLEQW